MCEEKVCYKVNSITRDSPVLSVTKGDDSVTV